MYITRRTAWRQWWVQVKTMINPWSQIGPLILVCQVSWAFWVFGRFNIRWLTGRGKSSGFLIYILNVASLLCSSVEDEFWNLHCCGSGLFGCCEAGLSTYSVYHRTMSWEISAPHCVCWHITLSYERVSSDLSLSDTVCYRIIAGYRTEQPWSI